MQMLPRLGNDGSGDTEIIKSSDNKNVSLHCHEQQKNMFVLDRSEYFSKLFCPLKGKALNKFNVYGFDVETEHIPSPFTRKSGKEVNCSRQDFIMGSVIGDDAKKVFWDREEMAKYLLSRRFRGSYMLATNLEFDFNQLFHDRLEEFHLVYSHGLIACVHRRRDDNVTDNGFKVEDADSKEDKKNKMRKWAFLDTMNYMRVSLEEIGKVVKVPKLPHPSTITPSPDGIGVISRRPVTEQEQKDLEEYNINDSTITYLFGKSMRDFCSHHNMKMKMTIGSTGMDFWRRNYQDKPLVRESDDLVMKHFQGSFKGGLTQVFKRGLYEGKMWYYDFRSSYPSCLVAGVDGNGTYPNPSTTVHIQNSTTEFVERYEGICFAKIKAPYRYIPYLGMKAVNGRLLFPYGTFSGWYTNFELRNAMNLGYEIEPGEMIYYHSTCTPFRECIKYLYGLRKQYKKEDNEYQAMVKVLMNSGIFGKWGTNPNNMEELIPLKKIIFKGGAPYYDGKLLEVINILENETPFEGFVTHKKPAKPFKYSFPIWSEYTTALGRNKLLQQIMKYPNEVCYVDTDSSIVTKPVFQEGDELGDWQLEHKLDGGLFIRSKLYEIKKEGAVDDKGFVCKSKGVGRFMNTRQKFENAVTAGKIAMERFTRMKESNRIHIKSGSVMRFSKFLSFEDDKRDWLGRKFSPIEWQNSEPLKVNNGEVASGTG